MQTLQQEIKRSRKMPYRFEEKKEENKYMNPRDFPEGESRIRVVSMPIPGWLDWNGNVPRRTLEEPSSSFNPRTPAKKIWTMQIWSYSKKRLYVFEVYQKSLIKSLEAFWDNASLGGYDDYDLIFQKKGTGLDSKYKLSACAPSKMPPYIKAAVESVEIRIEALFEGKDPWKDLTGFRVEQNFEKGDDDEDFENLG